MLGSGVSAEGWTKEDVKVIQKWMGKIINPGKVEREDVNDKRDRGNRFCLTRPGTRLYQIQVLPRRRCCSGKINFEDR